MDCPCGSGRTYEQCCALVHKNGAGLGSTAQDLMRARYSAYVLQLSEFVLSSWHEDTRPLDLGPVDPDHEWLGLVVLSAEGGGALDKEGAVEFKARFRRGAEFFELHERSSFERVSGKWVYIDGYEPETPDAAESTD